MVESVSMSAGIASRYAQAVFELADESSSLDELEKDVVDLRAAISDSADLRTLINSPVYGREDMKRAIVEVANKMGVSASIANTLALMAMKRRLPALPAMLARVEVLIDERKGIAKAEVVSARELSTEEIGRLSELLRRKAGKDVRIDHSVDSSLLGGLVVKLGSKMVDSSVKSRLFHLKSVMHEVF